MAKPKMPAWLNGKLHAVASRIYGDAAHVELHCLCATLFGHDHLSGLTAGQARLLLKLLDGGARVDPSPRRAGLISQLEALWGKDGDLRDHTLRVAIEKFGAPECRELDFCGIGRIAALIKIAQYYRRKPEGSECQLPIPAVE